MIPLTAVPASPKLHADACSKVDAQSSVIGSGAADADALAQAERFCGRIEPGRRLVHLYGPIKGREPTDGVRSLKGVPAPAAPPIACAKLSPAQRSG
jgi:hypothetical protein